MLTWGYQNEPVLFENPAAILDGSKPIRGGIPICFPWFAKGIEVQAPALLDPMHGYVRILLWDVVSVSQAAATLRVKTSSYDGTTLEIQVTYSITDSTLCLETKVTNYGEKSTSFDLALHTYFATSHPAKAQISGVSVDDPFTPILPIDAVFRNTTEDVIVGLPERTISIKNRNYSKSVIWNPGEKKPADLPTDPVIPEFLCVESLTAPTKVQPGYGWDGRVTYSVVSRIPS